MLNEIAYLITVTCKKNGSKTVTKVLAAMNATEAAYEFGYSVQMIRRAMIYHWRFAYWSQYFNYSDETAGDLQKWLSYMDDAIEALAEHLDVRVTRKLDSRLRGVKAVSLRIIAAYESGKGWDDGPFGEGACPGGPEWEALESFSRDALKNSPRLLVWGELGRAMGRLALVSILDRSDGNRIDVSEVVEAAQALNPYAKQAVPVFERCAEVPARIAASDPTQALNEMLGTPMAERASDMRPPHTRILHQQKALDSLIREGIQLLVDDRRRLLQLDDSDRQHCQAVLNGSAFAITYEQLLILRSLLDAGGGWLRSADMLSQHGSALAGKRLDRQISDLPGPIAELVERLKGHGGGYRVVLR